MRAIDRRVLRFVDNSPSKVSFSKLKRHFFQTHQTPTKELKRVVAGLIQAGKLCYTSHYGTSFIELSYDHPRCVSKHVVLKPRRCSLRVDPDLVLVTLKRGASFGGGEHPTTRLSIQLIDDFLHSPPWRDNIPALDAIDIGTGSGVLAIVAAKIGIGMVRAIDTDPCAVFEARENVRLNNLQQQVTVLDKSLEAIAESYHIIVANLRTPTLCRLGPLLEEKARTDSVLIFSGCKTDEINVIGDCYEKLGFSLLQIRSEKGWGALCLARGAISHEMVLPLVRHSSGCDRLKTGLSRSQF